MRTLCLSLLFMSCCFVAGVQAQQNPNGVLPLNNFDNPYLFLVRDPAVHQDLKLTPDVLKSLQAFNDQIDMVIWQTNNKQPAERDKMLAKAMSDTRAKLAGLLTAEQNKRIDQIQLWVFGMKSLMREDVARELQLDSSQRGEIRGIVTRTATTIAELRKQLNDGGDATELNKQYRSAQRDQQQGIIDLLSAEQKKSWVALLGQRIDVSKLGRIKFKAPELQAGSGWVNSEPLTLEKLKGKVVALHFYAFA